MNALKMTAAHTPAFAAIPTSAFRDDIEGLPLGY
jgi:hypothetical protein